MLLGSLVGRGLGVLLPHGSVRDVVAGRVPLGFAPTRVDLGVLDLTLGLHLHVNAVGLLVALWTVVSLARS